MADRPDTHDAPDGDTTRKPNARAQPAQRPLAALPPLPKAANLATPGVTTLAVDRRTSRFVLGAVASVALVVLGTIAVVAGRGTADGGDGGDSSEMDDAPLAYPASVLRDGEAELDRFLQTLTPRGFEVTTGGPSCWFAHDRNHVDPLEELWCGPVVFADSPDGTSWLRVPVSFDHEDDVTLATVGRVESRRTLALPDGYELRRLERDARLTPDEVEGLGRPGVAAAAPSTVGVVPTADMMQDLDPLDEGQPTGNGVSWHITGSATADRVFLPASSSGRGQIVEAAAGEQWLLLDVRTAASDVALDFAVVVDGTRRIPIAAGSVPRSGDTDEGAIAVSVPTDAQSLALVVHDGAVSIEVSFPVTG